jgi:hypothetical protein
LKIENGKVKSSLRGELSIIKWRIMNYQVENYELSRTELSRRGSIIRGRIIGIGMESSFCLQQKRRFQRLGNLIICIGYAAVQATT